VAHFPKPFFKKARKSWYVQIDRMQIKLGSDRDEGFRQYHQLMQQPAEQAVASPDSLVNIIDAFLEWTEQNRAPDTYEWYRYRLQRFVDKYQTGCRPQESLRVIGEYVDSKNARWIFPQMKSKGKKSPRIIYLNDEAMAITAIEIQSLYTEGHR
jgi:integrase